MAKQVLNANGETHGSIRVKINENFDELYQIEVTDNDAKLALPHVAAGQQVHVVDEKRVEVYLGDRAIDSSTSFILAGTAHDQNVGGAQPNAVGVFHGVGELNGKPNYSNSTTMIGWSGAQWVIGNQSDPAFTSNEDVDYPWQVTAWAVGGVGDGSVDSINRSPIATEENWRDVIPSYLLSVHPGSGSGKVVEGMALLPNVFTEIGWVNRGRLDCENVSTAHVEEVDGELLTDGQHHSYGIHQAVLSSISSNHGTGKVVAFPTLEGVRDVKMRVR